MNLENILFKNWSEWESGGISETLLEVDLDSKSLHKISSWYSAAHNSIGSPLQEVSLKTKMDIASWCLFGTHNLDDLPPEMRERRLLSAADKFKLNVKILIGLIVSARDLENGCE